MMIFVVGAMATTPVSAQTAADGVEFHYVLEDDPFDEGVQCTNGWNTGLDGPCDIWLFEAGNTADRFVFRFTQGTMNYGPGAETSQLNPRFAFEDPAGNAYRAHVRIGTDGEPRPVSFGSDQGPPPDGIEWAVDQEAGTITASFPLDSLEGVSAGATLTVLEISTAWALEGVLFWTNMDNIPDAPEVDIRSTGPALVEETVEGDEFAANVTLEEPTNATYVYQWNHTLQGQVQATYAADLTNGSVTLSVVDHLNETRVDVTLTENYNETLVINEVEAGSWTITASFVNAAGNFSMDVKAYTPPATIEPPEPSGNETTPAGNATSLNETDDGGLGIPGFGPLALVVGVVAALAAVGRRRRRQ